MTSGDVRKGACKQVMRPMCVGTRIIPSSGFRKLVSGQTTDMVRFAPAVLFAYK
jgi:hypothetical protein